MSRTQIRRVLRQTGLRGSDAAWMPAYDRRGVNAAVVHIGLGRFHRSHQAIEVRRLM